MHLRGVATECVKNYAANASINASRPPTNMNRKRGRWRYCRTHCGGNQRFHCDALSILCMALVIEIVSFTFVSAEELQFDITENLPKGTQVGTVGSGTQLLYVTQQSAGFAAAFEVAELESSGNIITAKVLDHENIAQYSFTLYDASADAIHEIVVNVLDENDNSPTFAEDEVTLEISELIQVGSGFNLGSALDEDAPPLNVKGYRMVGHSEYFGVNITELEDGTSLYAVLVVLKALDRETIPYHEVTVEAFDGGTPSPNTGKLVVNVSVSDSNDNAPVFTSSAYNVTMKESAIPGSDVITVRATDMDAGVNGDVSYSIDRTKSDPAEIFHVDAESGRIYLNEKLDSESATEHRLTVLATDHGAQPQIGSARVVVFVEDVNDNEPTINVIFLGANEGKVSEAAAIGDYIARVSVSDPDVGDVEVFNVTMTGGDGKFGLKTENNIVYLVRIEERLDREEKPSYDIGLQAIDFGSPPKSASVSFTIEVEDVNDNPPAFERDTYEVEISEDSHPGTFVIHLSASDPDVGINAQFRFSMLQSEQSDWFRLHEESGLITTATYLDHERNPAPQLTIVATDLGTPAQSSSATVIVRVGDTDDSDPNFVSSSYSAEVAEDTANGTCFLQVKAEDPDFPGRTRQVEYSFPDADSVPDRIGLDRNTGDLCITAELDREAQASYHFRVKATDQAGLHDFAQVSITVLDVNDNRPTFHPRTYVKNVDVTSRGGDHVVYVLATDGDDSSPDGSGFGTIVYSLVTGNEQGLFSLDNETGEISVAKPLSNQGGIVVQLRIRATDGGGLPSENDAIVTISILDGTPSGEGGPTFTKSVYNFETSESAAEGDLVGTVFASSVDHTGQSITYHIESDLPMSTWFSVESDSGIVTVASDLDREIFPTVTLQIIASVGSPPAYGYASLVIRIDDVNDNAPFFTPSSSAAVPPPGGIIDTIKIPYSTLPDAEVYQLAAHDADSGDNSLVRFALMDDAGFFKVDPISGIVSVKQDLPTQTSTYRIVVQASDHGDPPKSVTGTLVVEALPPGGTCPIFEPQSYTVSIPENIKPASSFKLINATGGSVTYRLRPGVDAFSFGVYPDGSLYAVSTLDRELKDRYEFQLVAESVHSTQFTSPCTAIADVTVTIDDVNDNIPDFGTTEAQFIIEENKAKGSFVGKVSATDDDIGKNAQLLYSFVNANAYFSINGETGVITTTQPLDRESGVSHLLTVQATDGGEPSLMSRVSVRVYVSDQNDNAPVFLTGDSVIAIVEEGQASGALVSLVQAVDADIGDNAEISYSIVSGASGRFEVDPGSGRVKTTSVLNVNDQSYYTIQIKAEDGGSPKRSATSTLQVKVRASSENPAMYRDFRYAFFVTEGMAEAETVLGRFNTETSSNRVARSTDSSVRLTNFYVLDGDERNVFSVGPTSGELVTLQPLNYETKPQYILQVTAENELNTSDIYTFQAQINIQDTNDFAPIFSSASYQLTVQENAPINTKVWTFTATDGDIGSNGDVTYSILNQSSTYGAVGGDEQPFWIDAETGQLFTNSDLDRESVAEYTLIVQAKDGSVTSPRLTTVSAVITVRDTNDHAPRFVSSATTYVMEDEPIGFPVAYVAAEDDDAGANAHVTYSLIHSWTDKGDVKRGDESFSMDADTGVVTIVKKLDYETASKHFLNVSATDGASSDPLSSFQLIVINVLDVNDEAPRFLRAVYFAEIEENQDAGSLVTRVTANDGDSGENGRLTYELHDKTSSFEINPATGVILTTRGLDREVKQTHVLTVYVHDGAFPALYDLCSVEVTVIDTNDNPPIFAGGIETAGSLSLGELEIPEYLEAPAFIRTVIASDADTGLNGKISYSISEGNTGDAFMINSTTGELRMVQRLDREQTDSYRLKLVAADRGSPQQSSEAYLSINVLDWNDNDPVFTESSYHGEISEALPSGQFVLTVHADDLDLGENGEITYSIDSDMNDGSPSAVPEGLFSIDPETGVITTTAVLDREKKTQHQLTVRAIDSAPYSPRKTTVAVTIDVIDVNDNAPIFTESLIVKNVSEMIAVESDIATVQAQDKDFGDNGTVFYRISGGSTEPYGSWTNKFKIDNDGRVTTLASLSGAHTYYINITASDNGSPPNTAEAMVIVNVVPFTVPNFSQVQFRKTIYRTDISELIVKGSLVTEVEANLYENGKEVEDTSGVTITYNFPSGNEDNAFAISSDGRITVKDPSLLDYETLPNIRLIVSAAAITTGGAGAMYAYSTVYVDLIDENDNTPRFAQDRYVTEVWEQQDAGTYVLQVSAHDLDKEANGEVRYYIDSGNTDHSFQVDDITGIVTTAQTLDREIHNEYKLMVHAYDLGAQTRTGSCMLKITVVDINDHKPTLSVPPPGSLSMAESVDIGTLITTVTANDPDSGSKISFELDASGDNQNDYFTIDRQSGQIHLAKALDYEIMHQATVSVRATDGQFSDKASVVVTIEDENDNPPVFRMQSYQATLDELSPLNTSVIRVQADDVDSGDGGVVTYSLRESVPNKAMFRVDSETGWIFTTMVEAFNPQSSIYNLIILAEDHGAPSLNCTVSVRIQIKDINNHAPAFSPELYEASVSEAAELSTHVINVTATDGDFSRENRYVSYEIVSGNKGSVFRIVTYAISGGESTVGMISVDGNLDRENISSYTLVVRASDQGGEIKFSDTTVSVTVVDVNDNQPVFNQSSYVASVSEDATQRAVVEVNAHDPDSSSDLMFKITAGNDDSAFELGECVPSSAGCRAVIAKILDYEVKAVYKLTVQVWDGRDTTTSHSSVVPVTINILDVNEYSPYFAGFFQTEKISESTGANETLFWVSGLDKDGGRYGQLQYYIIADDNQDPERGCLTADEMFLVVRLTGEVRSLHAFDYESCKSYHFNVRAENINETVVNTRGGGIQPRTIQKSAVLPINVEVSPVDEYAPTFDIDSGNLFEFSVPYDADVGYVFGQINATDEDAGEGEIIYEIDIGNQDQEFEIDRSSGEMRLSRRLENSKKRILGISATSGRQTVETFVSIDITGAPAIALEAQILAIVFGVIAGIAVLIVLILCWKHRRSKKAQRHPDATPPRKGRTEPEYYDEVPPQLNRDGVPVPAPRMVTNQNGRSTSGKSDNQLNRSGSGRTNTTNGYIRHSVSTNGHVHIIENGGRGKTGLKTKAHANGHAVRIATNVNGHPVPYKRNHSTSSGRGSDDDDDYDDEDEVDREVNQINSSSDTANGNTNSEASSKPKIRRKLSGQGRNKKVPDSGIQKDIDTVSDISDGPNNIAESKSVESIHEFGVEGAGEEPLDIQDIEEDLENDRLEEGMEVVNLSRGEAPPSVKSDPHSYTTANGSEAKSGTSDSLYNRREHLTKWAPEFQPLADVFSEIARLKDGTAARGPGQTFVMRDLAKPRITNTVAATSNPDVNMPPPLITSVADQRNDIVAPVPLGYSATRFRPPPSRNPGGVGLYPNSNPQYRAAGNLPRTGYLPSLYTSAPLRMGNGGRQYVAPVAITAAHRGQIGYPLPQAPIGLGVSSLNSSQQGLSVSSLSRTPISHESSFTSPAMSPNLSPSLSPLATRSPSVSPLTVGEGPGYESGSTRLPNPDPTRRVEDGKQRERMVHI